jgi:cytochrome c oxidase subunit II
MLLALLIGLVTLVTTAGFLSRRFWMPGAINPHALSFDSWFTIVIAALGIVFVAAQVALAWVIVKHRDRGQRAAHSHGAPRLEIFWTAATAVIFLAAAGGGARLWSGLHLTETPGAMRVEVLAKQFAWNFRYAGPDGRFSRTKLELRNDATGNPFGIDDTDPAARDDVSNAALRVPAGQPIELRLNAQDVIHSFFVRELRIKQDAVPGMEIPLRFVADKPGTYEIACAELCGLGHHQMRSVLIVMPPTEFQSWLAAQKKP